MIYLAILEVFRRWFFPWQALGLLFSMLILEFWWVAVLSLPIFFESSTAESVAAWLINATSQLFHWGKGLDYLQKGFRWLAPSLSVTIAVDACAIVSVLLLHWRVFRGRNLNSIGGDSEGGASALAIFPRLAEGMQGRAFDGLFYRISPLAGLLVRAGRRRVSLSTAVLMISVVLLGVVGLQLCTRHNLGSSELSGEFLQTQWHVLAWTENALLTAALLATYGEVGRDRRNQRLLAYLGSRMVHWQIALGYVFGPGLPMILVATGIAFVTVWLGFVFGGATAAVRYQSVVVALFSAISAVLVMYQAYMPVERSRLRLLASIVLLLLICIHVFLPALLLQDSPLISGNHISIDEIDFLPGDVPVCLADPQPENWQSATALGGVSQ